jgi:hypothetical protein
MWCGEKCKKIPPGQTVAPGRAISSVLKRFGTEKMGEQFFDRTQPG